MKTIKLTKFECDVIADALDEYKLCEATCYCNYKTDMCNKMDSDGNWRCELKRAINDIVRKLGYE